MTPFILTPFIPYFEIGHCFQVKRHGGENEEKKSDKQQGLTDQEIERLQAQNPNLAMTYYNFSKQGEMALPAKGHTKADDEQIEKKRCPASPIKQHTD